ncbi:Ig-like domain-containing protein [Roseiconus lacunae]|uniref:Ig-like domain-containing protein n=1 Tax=Roseiconus lacunae TaxID=2605694 RepID=UPI0011F0C903|nr:dockerin type I domain-containing protein [Roseiconus lacunae]
MSRRKTGGGPTTWIQLRRDNRINMGRRRRSIRCESNSLGKPLSLRLSSDTNLCSNLPSIAGASGAVKRDGVRRRLVFETLGQRRVLAVISGAVFHDLDGSMRPDPAEQRLDSRLAYIDSNDNASLDPGEAFQVADANGEFQFDGVPTGIHPVRLFEGSSFQNQTFPVEASDRRLVPQLDLSDAVDAVRSGNQLHIATSQSVVVMSTSGTSMQGQTLPFSTSGIVSAIESETGPRATLVLGDSGGRSPDPSALWLVHAAGNEPELLFSGTSIDATVGQDGHGLIVEYGENETILHSFHTPRVRAGDQSGNQITVRITPEPQFLPAQAQVLASATAIDVSPDDSSELVSSRSVIAWPVASQGADGQESPALHTSLWDNRSADWIEGSQTVIVGAKELLSFDDEAGLLAIRGVDGEISVLDVEANFAELQQFEAIDGTAQFVGDFNAIAMIEQLADGNTLTLRDVQSKAQLASYDLGTVTHKALVPGDDFASYYSLSTAGVTKIAFRQNDAHRINVTQVDEVHEANFGLRIENENVPPVVQPDFLASAVEDETYTIPSSEFHQLVSDPEGDRLIPLIVQTPVNGDVEFTEDGDLRYEPDADYYGNDSFSVRFHDGQSVSEPVTVSVNVASRPDTPTGITFFGGEIPEHTIGPYVVGGLSVEDADFGDEHQLTVYDHRFAIEGGDLVLVNGPLNYEFESVIYLTIAGIDRATGTYFSQEIAVRVGDENDPVTQLVIGGSDVEENVSGVYIARLSSYDEDRHQPTEYSVDDQRFEIRNDNELWLKDDETLDHETEPTVVMTVSAKDNAGSSTSKEFRLNVLDQPEYGGTLRLTNETVVELEAGATVGEVRVDGLSVEVDSYSVDDTRFEVDGRTLKLLDDVFVRRSAAEEIGLTVTAYLANGETSSISTPFVIEVLENASPFHNDDNPYDVDGNGTISPIDALAIINFLNRYGPGPVGPGDPGYGYDVNKDGQVTPLDALLVINILNAIQSGATVGGAKMNDVVDPDATNVDEGGQAEAPSPDASVQNSASRMMMSASFALDLPAIDESVEETDSTFWASSLNVDPLLSVDEAQRATDWLNEIRDEEDTELNVAIDELLVLLQQSLR